MKIFRRVNPSTFYIILAFVLFMLIGWVMNLVKLLGMLDGEMSALFVSRVVGLFIAPFGSLMGFF